MSPPRTPTEAEVWIETAVGSIGHEFHPDRRFHTYGLIEAAIDLDKLDRAREASHALLGKRIYDIAYRSAEAYLADRDPEWEPHFGPLPATQPPPRWWLIKRPHESHVSSFEPPLSVAYEDEFGTWWRYDPDTGRLYDEPWLFTEYYYQPSHLGDFAQIPAEEVRRLVAVGLPRTPDNEHPRPGAGEDSLDLEVALRGSSDGPALNS